MGQHSFVFGAQTPVEAICFHLLYVLQLDPSWVLQLQYLDLLWQAHTKFGNILPWSLLGGIKLLIKGVKHHYHAIMLVQHLEDIIQGGILTWTPGQVSQEPLQWPEDTWQQMLVIPTQAAENSYVPLPWAVSYSIFGLFWRLANWPSTSDPSCPHWSVTFSGHCHHGWLLGTSIITLIWSLPRGGWTIRNVSRKSWSSLSSVLSTTSASTLRMSVSLL